MTRFISAIYHPNIKAAEFIADDGRHLIRAGGSLQWRICNGGDLVSPSTNGMPTPKKTRGYIGFAKSNTSDNHFFIFPDYETGRAELKASLLRKYSEKTLSKTIEIYAPSSDGNDSASYTTKLSKLANISSDTQIKDLSEQQLDVLMDGIERLEGYHANAETRKEIWVNVSHIQATDGNRPLADEEIILRIDGKEHTLTSNAVGQFPPIVHGIHPIEVAHKTVDGTAKNVGELPVDRSQNFNLLTRVTEFIGITRPVEPPKVIVKKKQPLEYTVQAGDTLMKIAEHFQIGIAELRKDNQLIKDRILVGQVIGIYGSAPKAPISMIPKRSALKLPPLLQSENALQVVQTSSKSQAKKISKNPPTQTKVIPARSKDGKGEALALITPEDGVAPWMKYAIAEAKFHKGNDESVIEKSINYHAEIKDGLNSMRGTQNAWCAAFVNWCLMKAGYPIENPKETGFVDWKSSKMRADGFRQLRGQKHSKSQEYNSIQFIKNPIFIKISAPTFGSIAVSTTSDNHGQHVGFVYGRCSEDSICLLGGNQGDRVKFSPYEEFEKNLKVKKRNKAGEWITHEMKSNHLEFFVPATYIKFHNEKTFDLAFVKVEYLNKIIGIDEKINSAESHS